MTACCALRPGLRKKFRPLPEKEKKMKLSYGMKIIMGLVGTAIMATFVIGLSHSISTGFAGFSGGLPFMIITIIVLAMAFYDFWDECVRKKK